MKKKPSHEIAYDASLEAFREASRKFSAVVKSFRSGRATENEFLAARAEFRRAEAVADDAESTFIIACNS